jgi:O-acetyl-ADP-ribose deacetylase (regulator of RNase III)
MNPLFNFELVYGDVQYRVELSAEAPLKLPDHVDVLWGITVDGDDAAPAEVRHRIDLTTGSVTITSLLDLSPLQACLAACGVAGLVGPLVGCLKRKKQPGKSNQQNDAPTYIECLKERRHSVAEDVAKCLIGCGGGAIASGPSA